MPTKEYDARAGACRVEFRLPPESGAQRAWLAGDFNDWSTDACPLERADDGTLAVSVLLEPGRSYRFRYYLGDGEWENDWAADEYVENDHGGADSVVHVPAAPAEPPPATKAVKKKAATKKATVKKKAAAKKKDPPPA
jgi:1,4-alpha-glucan branching enzyme